MKMHYFGFIDESGVNSQDRFFGIGLLVVKDTGTLYGVIKRRYDQLRTLADAQKTARINQWVQNGQIDELALMARRGKDFELKFDRINSSNNTIYRDLIEDYFNVPDVRFTALIIDKNDPSFNPIVTFPGTWEAYLTYGAMVLARELSNIQPASLCALIDYISKPSNITTIFEEEITLRTNQKLIRRGITNASLQATQMESHASLMIQMVDVLLGCVMFEYKSRNGLVSTNLQARREIVPNQVKTKLNRINLKGDFTVHTPSYFSVWEIQWR